MINLEVFLSERTDTEISILNHILAFPNFFSIDWFSIFPPSELISLLLALDKEGWIVPKEDKKGYYEWSQNFPQNDLIMRIPSEKMAEYYRKSVEILSEKMPPQAETTVMIASQCISAGIRPGDLETIFQAALSQENNHKISSAVALYDASLEYIEHLFSREKDMPTDDIWRMFIKIIERRAALSLFHPSLKKNTKFLFMALEAARNLGNLQSEASLELLIGQNHWFLFQYKEAIVHLKRGWSLISELDDDMLQKRGAKARGLTYYIAGRLREAIEYYEKSLGNMESADNNDFSLLIALNLALCYTQVGMPQRGLGICNTIQNQCAKDKNWPLLAYSFATAGMILLEIRQFQNSRSYFEKARRLSERENIPAIEVMTGYGLASIDYYEGDLQAASEHFAVIWKTQKSSWFYYLNLYHLFEIGYMLHLRGVSPIELGPIFEYLRNIKQEDLNPLMYGIIQRLQIMLLEEGISAKEKIQKLLALKNTIEKMGPTFELAKIRIDLATLYLQTGQMQEAEAHARKAWDFLKPIAGECFPAGLLHLIPKDQLEKDDDLFKLILEMGEALTDQENIEQLLTNIITSISRMTGSERTALFIKAEGNDLKTADPRLIASRNLLKEEILDEKFKESLEAIRLAAHSVDGKIIQFDITGQDPLDVRNVIINPLRLGQRIIGVLYQDSRFFSINMNPDKIVILSALASQIAVSIDRAKAYEEIADLNKKLIQENQYHIETESQPFGEIIGSSKAVSEVHRLIQKVAPTQSTVLIHGETGVGKELVARAIHRASRRSQAPFIRVNCAALPEGLIDSELFGHEKGAFTGAVKTKFGRFELAHQGTLFLDEISELPLPTQSRLLRVLQEKEFQRVGGTRTLYSDFRLIAATNKILKKEVEEGRFREDLFYRLNVFPIHVPPLRERIEDIHDLAFHFYNFFCIQNNKTPIGIQESEVAKLKAYSWPGNIRELSNMIERAVISGEQKIRFPELTIPRAHEPLISYNADTQNIRKAQILDALKKTEGKVGGKDGAAALLSLKRTTLIHRMKKYDIKVDNHRTIRNDNL